MFMQRNPSIRIQYSRDFLLSRKCVLNSGEVLAHVKIHQFNAASLFSQAGIKKILWAKKQAKIRHLSDSHSTNPPTFKLEMDSILTAEKENYVPSSSDLAHLQAQFELKLKTVHQDNEKIIKDLKTKHYKQIQDLKLKERLNFEKTLGVANTVISVDKDEQRAIEKKLKEQLHVSDTTKKAFEEENTVLKEQLDLLQNELAATKLQAEDDKKRIETDAAQLLEATRVTLTEDVNKAKNDFLRVFEMELECAICSELFVEVSIVTSCLHVFCRHCIITCYRQRGAGQNANCPMCRAPYTEQNVKALPLVQSLLTKIEDKLPHDILMRRQATTTERRRNPV